MPIVWKWITDKIRKRFTFIPIIYSITDEIRKRFTFIPIIYSFRWIFLRIYLFYLLYFLSEFMDVSLYQKKNSCTSGNTEKLLLGVVKESSRDLLSKRNPNRLTPSLRPLYSFISLFFLHHIFVFVRGNDCQCSKKKKKKVTIVQMNLSILLYFFWMNIYFIITDCDWVDTTGYYLSLITCPAVCPFSVKNK